MLLGAGARANPGPLDGLTPCLKNIYHFLIIFAHPGVGHLWFAYCLSHQNKYLHTQSIDEYSKLDLEMDDNLKDKCLKFENLTVESLNIKIPIVESLKFKHV